MFGEVETSVESNPTARKATAAATTQRNGALPRRSLTIGTIPTAAKRRTTAYLGVNVTPLVFVDAARQRPAAPMPANTPSGLAPPNRIGKTDPVGRTDSRAGPSAEPLVRSVPSARLEWSSMARSVKWLIPVFTVVVVLTTAVIHSQYVALIPYPLTQEPRFKWVLIFIALLWLTSYAAGLPDPAGTPLRRIGRTLAALAAADGIISVFSSSPAPSCFLGSSSS